MPLKNTAIEIWNVCGQCYIAATSALQALTWYNAQNQTNLQDKDLELADPSLPVALHNPCSSDAPEFLSLGQLVREHLNEGGLLPAYIAAEAVCPA